VVKSHRSELNFMENPDLDEATCASVGATRNTGSSEMRWESDENVRGEIAMMNKGDTLSFSRSARPLSTLRLSFAHFAN
jgi:hypothetical protein